MRLVGVERVRIEGFKSFTRPCSVELGGPGLTLVTGVNRVEPRLGANGVGKSTIWDALCFCLYGVAIDGTRIGELVAEEGDGKIAVSVTLTIDGEEYVVARTGPPSRVTINDKPASQPEVDRLVGLTQDRFLHSVVFGQNVLLFVNLSPPQRGEILDEILGSRGWMIAAGIALTKSGSEGARLNSLRIEIGRVEGALASLGDLSEIEAEERGWEEQRERQIETLLTEFEAEERSLSDLKLEQQNLQGDASSRVRYLWDSYQVHKKREGQLSEERARLEQRLTSLLEDINQFKGSGDVCPVCTQEITPEFADRHLGDMRRAAELLRTQLAAFDRPYADARAAANAGYETWYRESQEEKKSAADDARLVAQISSTRRRLDDLEGRITSLGTSENPHTARRIKQREEQETLLEEFREKKAEEDAIRSRIASYDFWAHAFRRVRLFFIRRVLAQLEVETSSAAAELGLVGWHISYATETETKSGTTRLGVQVVIKSPRGYARSFNTWSGGEGHRVRLAVALGFASLIQRWAGVRWNIEVFDEPTTWLSEQGIEDLLQLLKSRSEVRGSCIYLCDHRALSFSGFTQLIQVVKDVDGSRIE